MATKAQGQVGLLADTPSLPLCPRLPPQSPSGAQISLSQNQLKRVWSKVEIVT